MMDPARVRVFGEFCRSRVFRAHVNELIKAGTKAPEIARRSSRSPYLHQAPARNARASVGIEAMEAYAGDLFLQRSDGLVALVDPDEILEVCLTQADWDGLTHLVDLANHRGAIDDIAIGVSSMHHRKEALQEAGA